MLLYYIRGPLLICVGKVAFILGDVLPSHNTS